MTQIDWVRLVVAAVVIFILAAGIRSANSPAGPSNGFGNGVDGTMQVPLEPRPD